MKWRTRQVRFLVLSTLVAVGCGSDAKPEPLAGQVGTPTTGEVPGTAMPGDGSGAALAAHEARIKAALGKLGEPAAALERWRATPLVEADLSFDVAAAPGSATGFTARWRYAAVNDSGATLRAVMFEVPANRDARAGDAAPVSLTRAEVAGQVVSAAGTSARWEIPVEVVAGGLVDVTLTLRGTLPAVRAQSAAAAMATPSPKALGAADDALGLGALLDKLGDVPELASMMPVMPLEDGGAARGVHGEVAVVSGMLPMPSAPALVQLDVTSDAEHDVDASGVRIGVEKNGARATHHFVVGAARDIAVVTSRGLSATTTRLADVAVTIRGADGASALTATVRRALEDGQSRFGAGGPKELALVAWPGDAVVAMPGVVLVPASALAEPESQATTAHSPARKLSLSSLLGGIAEHHPGAKEALAYALASAVLHTWWSGVGADRAAELVLAHGLARAVALDVVADKNGDKAERRALEFGLKLPVQLALQDGERDVVLSALAGSAAPVPELAALKAGLFVEALTRHLGETQTRALTDKLRAGGPASSGAVSLDAFRKAVLEVAPRPDEARALMARWLDEMHLAEDVGPLRPEVLLEYFVADGAIQGLSSQLMDQLGAGQLGGKALELLGKGQGLDAGLAVSLFAELAGQDADPTTKKWLDLGAKLMGGGADRQQAVEALVQDLATELGIPENDRSRLKQLSALVMQALDDPGKIDPRLLDPLLADPNAPPNPAAPPAPDPKGSQPVPPGPLAPPAPLAPDDEPADP